MNQLRVTQLTADHNLENATELRRLAVLGVDTDKICQSRKMAGRFYTRSIGDYYIKQQYSNIDLLRYVLQQWYGMMFWLHGQCAVKKIHGAVCSIKICSSC